MHHRLNIRCGLAIQVFQAVNLFEVSFQAPSKSNSKMPGQTVRSAAKNMSKSARAKDAKNTRRVEAAINDQLDYCTYGRVSKTLGNKMFYVIDTDRRQHLGHIRGKMARIKVDDVVLLNIRDYESRASTDAAVYDIVAVFDSKKDISRLIKSKMIPRWFLSTTADEESDCLHEIFDYGDESESDAEADDDANTTKKDKKSHRKAGKNAAAGGGHDDSDVDVDAI